VLLKREDQQPVFSQLRGRIQQDGAPDARAAKKSLGVICASVGNHAQGVALRAQSTRKGDRHADDHAAGQD
jgi:threonine dehydratase